MSGLESVADEGPKDKGARDGKGPSAKPHLQQPPTELSMNEYFGNKNIAIDNKKANTATIAR
jgi:hypothetical protein